MCCRGQNRLQYCMKKQVRILVGFLGFGILLQDFKDFVLGFLGPCLEEFWIGFRLFFIPVLFFLWEFCFGVFFNFQRDFFRRFSILLNIVTHFRGQNRLP